AAKSDRSRSACSSPCARDRNISPAGGSGNRAASNAKLRWSLLTMRNCSPASQVSLSRGTAPVSSRSTNLFRPARTEIVSRTRPMRSDAAWLVLPPTPAPYPPGRPPARPAADGAQTPKSSRTSLRYRVAARNGHPAGLERVSRVAAEVEHACDDPKGLCSDFRREEVANHGVDRFAVMIGHREHREMAPRAVDDPQFAVWDQGLLILVIGNWEEHVSRERGHERLGFDPAQRGGKVATGVLADVAVPPLPCHREEVIGVHGDEPCLPEVAVEVVERRKSDLSPVLVLVKLLGDAHDRPQLRVRLEDGAHFGWVVVETATPGGVCLDDILVRAHEEPVVWRGLGCSSEGDRSEHHVRVPNGPLVGLLGSHRPAEHKLQRFDAERLGYEQVLGTHV